MRTRWASTRTISPLKNDNFEIQKNGCTGKERMMVQAKEIQKCTINVTANDPGYGRTTKNLNGN